MFKLKRISLNTIATLGAGALAYAGARYLVPDKYKIYLLGAIVLPTPFNLIGVLEFGNLAVSYIQGAISDNPVKAAEPPQQ